MAFYYFNWGDLLRERNDLEVAERLLANGMDDLKGTTMLPDNRGMLLGYTTLARLQQARGEYAQALSTLDTFMHLADVRRFPPHLAARGVAVRAHVELMQGNVEAAGHWADASGLSTYDDELGYLHEQEYLILARVRTAQGRLDPAGQSLQEALHLLDRLLMQAEAKARRRSVLEILILQALALHGHNDLRSALVTLERAFVLAAPERYIRLFIDEGMPMLILLRQAQRHGIAPAYVTTLLSVFGDQRVSDTAPSIPIRGGLVEPLTEREREVLRYLLEGASNREIAHRLVLSINTVKRHIYNICGKLDVQSRIQAIVKARTLNLV